MLEKNVGTRSTTSNVYYQASPVNDIKNGGLNKMNKTELVAAMAEASQLSKKDAEAALNALTATIAEELRKGEKVSLIGFGTFEVAERAAREGKNPATGEKIQIAACKSPKFKAGKALKDSLN